MVNAGVGWGRGGESRSAWPDPAPNRLAGLKEGGLWAGLEARLGHAPSPDPLPVFLLMPAALRSLHPLTNGDYSGWGGVGAE